MVVGIDVHKLTHAAALLEEERVLAAPARVRHCRDD